MSERLLVSVFLLWHLTAIAVVAVPSAVDLQLASGVPPAGTAATSLGPLLDAPPPSDDAISAVVRPALDAAHGITERLAAIAWERTTWVRPLAARYADTFGLAQTWSMFGNPPRGSEYLRLRYYTSTADRVADDGASLTSVTELVFPSPPGQEPRLVTAYSHGHRDKAISNAVTAYLRSRISGALSGARTDETAVDSASRRLGSVVRYFAAREARRAPAGERLVRTEAWYGWATSRVRGDVPIAPRARAATLARYHEGAIVEARRNHHFQDIDSFEREADLLWMLIAIETP